RRSVNVVMEAKRGTKKSRSGSSNSSKRQQYEAPLGYIIEDVRPHGGIEKFRSAAYSNVRLFFDFFDFFEFLMREETILIPFVSVDYEF
ncbi:hypothetical protein SDJN02_17499, partial [Cucurbita argyrosperma subsp. argyrosperma]